MENNMAETRGTEFAGIMVNGTVFHNDKIKLRRDTLKKIIKTGKVTITRTTYKLDDTGVNEPNKVFTPDEFADELKQPPVVSHLDLTTRTIRYCPSQHCGFDITLNDDNSGFPLSIRLQRWLREQKATPYEMLDGVVAIFGMVYNAHKDTNTELLKAQTIVEQIAAKIK